jgi:tetratricopeptide (TPR) repeat protein
MLKSLEYLNRVRKLAETGQHAAVVDYLSDRPDMELKDSPTLALLFGTAQARLGRHDEGTEWVELALGKSRDRGDKTVESHALNVRGAIALVSGSIDEAAEYFTQALAAARNDGDNATIGRCSNNLGIIYNLSGRYAEAIGSYTMAIAAFQQAGMVRGLAETHHNFGITYCEQGDLDRALEEANAAVEKAEASGDMSLSGLTWRGRAEVHLRLSEWKVAQKEIDRALKVHRELEDTVEEAEDLRIVGMILAYSRKLEEAELVLSDVIQRAESLSRPQLAADATRDLAQVLRDAGREDEAREAAQAARVLFSPLGAEVEIRKIDKAFS